MLDSRATREVRDEVETEIYADLVETLFGTPGSFLAGVFGGLLVPTVALFSTGDAVYAYLLALMALFGIYRIYVLVSHERTTVPTRRQEARKWEIRYAFGGIGFMTVVGVTTAILFNQHHDQMTVYYGIVIMTACAGALAARNSGSPPIVFGQAIGTLLPLAITCLFYYNAWYWGLTALLTLFLISVKSTTKFLHANLEAALRSGRDANIHRKRFKSALNSMSHGLCMGNADKTLTVVNRRLFEFFGLKADETPQSLRTLARQIADKAQMPDDDRRAFVEQWEKHAALPKTNVFSRQIGERIFDFRCEPADNGAFVTVVEDVTEQRRAVREIERIAHFDTLTNLPNRFQFQQRLERDLRYIRKRGQCLALMSIDLDQFKEVNDSLGHTIGDRLLRAVADRLRECVRSVDMVARFGGDEFCILLYPADHMPPAESFAQRIIETIDQPYVIEGHTILIGASIGLCSAPRDATSAEGLLKCGDLAMYHSKATGRRKALWFDSAMEDALLNKRRIERDLREALRNNGLDVHYQPIVDARDQSIATCEALVRWRHAEKGFIPPSAFIPIAEETGMIVELGEWVLRKACRDAQSWPSSTRLAVNFSPKQFQQANMVSLIKETLADVDLDPNRLEIEITESTLMQDTEDAAAKVAGLRALGVRLSLDDFGTGFSSLGYLNRFPVDKVKLDRSFISELTGSPKTQAIIGAVALLAEDLDIDLVAEGVETHEQLTLLRSKNVHLIQGFLFSQPKPLAELQPMFATPRKDKHLKVVA